VLITKAADKAETLVHEMDSMYDSTGEIADESVKSKTALKKTNSAAAIE